MHNFSSICTKFLIVGVRIIETVVWLNIVFLTFHRNQCFIISTRSGPTINWKWTDNRYWTKSLRWLFLQTLLHTQFLLARSRQGGRGISNYSWFSTWSYDWKLFSQHFTETSAPADGNLLGSGMANVLLFCMVKFSLYSRPVPIFGWSWEFFLSGRYLSLCLWISVDSR